MKNFYEVNCQAIFNVDTYLKNWEKSLKVRFENNDVKKEEVQRLASHVQRIWKNFNEDRSKLEKHYMDSGINLAAYVASFLLPNIERVSSLLARDENAFVLEELLRQEREEIVIADFGCGPLSGSVGVLAFLEYILSQHPSLKLPDKITIYAIDRAEKVIDFGSQLLLSSLQDTNQLNIIKLTSVEKIEKPLDIVLCINVLNEIPVKHRIKPLKTLYEKMKNGGVALILEPGQEEHAKSLGDLRDEFLQTAVECEVISPCAHKKQCPLSHKSSRRDWCWFRHCWNPPHILTLLDKFSKIDHYELNFSYLFLQKSKIKTRPPFFARCVSDEFQVDIRDANAHYQYFSTNLIAGDKEKLAEFSQHERGVHKILLCTQGGELESAFVIADPNQKSYRRGRQISTSSELSIRAKERFI